MSLKIRFVTDYVCPYCLAAKIPLMEAVRGKEIEIEWLPYELTEEPAARVDTYHDEVRRVKWAQSLAPAVKALGIEMKLPPKVIPRPYTRLAFEGFHYAGEHGCGDAYNDRVYTAYFMEEQDIGDPAVLCTLAAEVGLDAEDFRRALEAGTYTSKQKAAVAYAKKELDIHSVPTIFIGETRLEGGIYTKEGFLNVIDDAMRREGESVRGGVGKGKDGMERKEVHTVKGESCDIHGCGI